MVHGVNAAAGTVGVAPTRGAALRLYLAFTAAARYQAVDGLRISKCRCGAVVSALPLSPM